MLVVSGVGGESTISTVLCPWRECCQSVMFPENQRVLRGPQTSHGMESSRIVEVAINSRIG